MMIRIPKPSHLLSQLTPGRKPDTILYQTLQQLADIYQLGEIQSCYRAPRSKSLNFFVTTAQGKFVFRRQQLPEDAVAYEYQILDHLQRCNFPAPRMRLDRDGRAWITIDEKLYSIYNFMDGYCPSNFLWLPTTQCEIIHRCGRTLGEYHQAVADLVPTTYKWNGYCAETDKRWCNGEWFLQAVKDIRFLLSKLTDISPIDNFTCSRLDAIEQMLKLEPLIEERLDLSKLVIHGDYAPWNVHFRSGRRPFVLDFNESRLDLKIYDIVLATFWFAWFDGRLKHDRVLAFQTGYNETGQLSKIDIKLAGPAFQWVMARSLIERLYKHYRGQRLLTKSLAGLESQYQMCIFAEQYPQQLVVGLNGGRRQ